MSRLFAEGEAPAKMARRENLSGGVDGSEGDSQEREEE